MLQPTNLHTNTYTYTIYYIYPTARDNEPKSQIDFAPLSVEYQERFSSAGMTSGGFRKREVS